MGPISRRASFRLGTGLALGATATGLSTGAPLSFGQVDHSDPRHPYLTPADDFPDVSRGDPIPHTLEGDALVKARLTPETWGMEVAAEGKAELAKPLRHADGTSIDLAT